MAFQPLQPMASPATHRFLAPAKRIHDGDDVSFFLASRAYVDLMTFLFQLNAAMFPRRIREGASGPESVRQWELGGRDAQQEGESSHVPYPAVVQQLATLLENLGDIVNEAPPDTGPRRFGNASFRTWHSIVQERLPGLLDRHLPAAITELKPAPTDGDGAVSATVELQAYLSGSFGSAQRLDYGTGHELSFLAFLCALWKLGAFPASDDGATERAIVLGLIEP